MRQRSIFLVFLICSVILFSATMLATPVAADPANAILDITVSNPAPEVGQQLVISFTLTQYDFPVEQFNDWRVRLQFDPAVLQALGCTSNPDVWNVGGFPAAPGCDIDNTNGSVFVGQGDFVQGSVPTPPALLLGTVTFDVVGDGGSNFVTPTGFGDTDFALFPAGFPTWFPGTINIEQVNVPLAVTMSGISATGSESSTSIGLVAAALLSLTLIVTYFWYSTHRRHQPGQQGNAHRFDRFNRHRLE